MASIRYRNDKWQVQVRRYGHTPQSKSFQAKADAQRWARHVEAELDRTLIPNDPRVLNTVTVADVLSHSDRVEALPALTRPPRIGLCFP